MSMNKETRKIIAIYAERVREYLGVTGPITNIDQLVTIGLGGEIVEVDNIDEFSVGSIAKEGSSFKIYIPKGQVETRKNFTIAHELGHLFLHMGYLSLDRAKWDAQANKLYYRQLQGASSDEEIEANEFAAAFLMPENEYLQKLQENTVGNIVRTGVIAQYFNVSVEAASSRGKWLGYLGW